MANSFYIHIPVKRYVKKYLENRYGAPVTLPSQSVEQRLLEALLAHPIHRRDNLFHPSQYVELIKVMITEDCYFKKGNELTKTNSMEFNQFVEGMIKERMRIYCDVQCQMAVQIKLAIMDFMALNELVEDEDITFDGLQKDYYRYRKQRTEKDGGKLSTVKIRPTIYGKHQQVFG